MQLVGYVTVLHRREQTFSSVLDISFGHVSTAPLCLCQAVALKYVPFDVMLGTHADQKSPISLLSQSHATWFFLRRKVPKPNDPERVPQAT